MSWLFKGYNDKNKKGGEMFNKIKYKNSSIRLDENVITKLKKLAKKEGVSVNKIIDYFIRSELKKLGL